MQVDIVEVEVASPDSVSKLRTALTTVFDKPLDQLPENYGHAVPWGLLRLLDEGMLDCYYLVYVDQEFWSGSGGIVRDYEGKKVYQAGFRAFSKTRGVSHGLGSNSYTHEYSTMRQIYRAKALGCHSVILSFNEHNRRLYDLTRRYHIPKVFGHEHKFTASSKLQLFNGVMQWLLVMYL